MALPPRIGRYRILKLLGQGAMGVVYRGRDEGLDRDVAVKVIRGEAIDDESRAQFLKEARAAARLQHPGIVTVYELGEEAGAPFLAMELLEGQDLQRAMRQGALSDPRRALAVIEQVLSALGHAHARGIVHRDMKPSNVFLHAARQAKILDFGVARLGEGMTVTGRVVGTPHYMSPEQIRAERVDGRSDLFSTALIFYEMVTGAKAYRPGSAVTVMYQIVHEDADLSRLPPTPGGAALLAVLRRALTRERDQRYPDAESLSAALSAAVLEHAGPTTLAPNVVTPAPVPVPEPRFEAATAVPPPDLDLPYTATPSAEPAPTRAMGRGAVAAAIALSALAAGGVIWWWQARQSTLEAPLATASIGPLPAVTPTEAAPTPPPSMEAAASPTEAPTGDTSPTRDAGPPGDTGPPGAVPNTIPPPPTLAPVTPPTPAAAAPPSLGSPTPPTTRPSTPSRPESPAHAGPGDARSRLDRADQLFQSGRLGAALAEARAVLRDDPGNTEAKYLVEDIELDLAIEDYLKKARAALARGDRETARQLAEAGLRAKPNESRLNALLRELECR